MLGYIDTVRGKNGGVRLTCAPTDIVIGAVIRETGHEAALVQCKNKLITELTCCIEEAFSGLQRLSTGRQSSLRFSISYTMVDMTAFAAGFVALFDQLKVYVTKWAEIPKTRRTAASIPSPI